MSSKGLKTGYAWVALMSMPPCWPALPLPSLTQLPEGLVLVRCPMADLTEEGQEAGVGVLEVVECAIVPHSPQPEQEADGTGEALARLLISGDVPVRRDLEAGPPSLACQPD